MTVLPTPPSDSDRHSLTLAFLEHIDVIASDHVAPAVGEPTGPGLQTQQHFLSALLTLCEQNDWPLDQVFDKATKSPARIFNVDEPDGFLLVDPTDNREVQTWPRQARQNTTFELETQKWRLALALKSDSMSRMMSVALVVLEPDQCVL